MPRIRRRMPIKSKSGAVGTRGALFSSTDGKFAADCEQSRPRRGDAIVQDRLIRLDFVRDASPTNVHLVGDSRSGVPPGPCYAAAPWVPIPAKSRLSALVSRSGVTMLHCSVTCCSAVWAVHDRFRYGDSQNSGVPTEVRSPFGVRSGENVWRAGKLRE